MLEKNDQKDQHKMLVFAPVNLPMIDPKMNMEINGEAVVLKGRGKQASCLTTDNTLILRAQNRDTGNHATIAVAYGGNAPEFFELQVGFSTVTVPIKIANFNRNILTVTNTSDAEVAVRLNGWTCDGIPISENNDAPIVLNNNEIGVNCTPSHKFRELALTAQDNNGKTLIIYGIKDDNEPFILGLNCDVDVKRHKENRKEHDVKRHKGQTTQCAYLSYLGDAGYDATTLNNGFKLPVQKSTDVTVINISSGVGEGVKVELYTLER